MRAFAAVLLSLTLAACGSGEKPAPAPQDFVSVERTACFGVCPIYVARVDADDTLVFDGERFVVAEGRHTRALPAGSFEKLLEIAGRHDFASFDAAYPNEEGTNCGALATDLPGVNVTVKSARLSHSVRFYQGCFEFEGRERLEAMIAEMDAVLALDDWIGEREPFFGAGRG